VKGLLDLVLDGSKDSMKQTRTYEIQLKQPQNGAKLNPKLTPKSNRNRTREKHMKGGHLQR
jgi:hypothetical protein